MFSIVLKKDIYNTVFPVLSVKSDGDNWTKFLIYRGGYFVWVDSASCYLWDV